MGFVLGPLPPKRASILPFKNRKDRPWRVDPSVACGTPSEAFLAHENFTRRSSLRVLPSGILPCKTRETQSRADASNSTPRTHTSTAYSHLLNIFQAFLQVPSAPNTTAVTRAAVERASTRQRGSCTAGNIYWDISFPRRGVPVI